MYQKGLNRFARFAVEVFGEEYDFEHPERTALKGIQDMENLIRFLGLPKSLKEIGVTRDRLEMVANLCKLTKQDVMEILNDAQENGPAGDD